MGGFSVSLAGGVSDPLISFLVPAFNADKTLARAVNSITVQTSPNWEVVIIDDGSTDFTGAVADRLATFDERIQVIHQSNAGVSAARNAAMRVARGEYFAFVDADDTIVPDYVEKIEKLLQTGRPDAIAITAEFLPGGETIGFGRFDGRADEFLNMALTAKRWSFACWSFLIAKRIVLDNGLSFVEGRRVGEDQEFILKSLCVSSTCSSVDEADVYYCYRIDSPGSAMAMNLEGQFDYPAAVASVIDWLDERVNETRDGSYDEVRCLLVNMFVTACRVASKTSLINGADKVDVQHWLDDVILASGIDISLSELRSRGNRCFALVWKHLRGALPVLWRLENRGSIKSS